MIYVKFAQNRRKYVSSLGETIRGARVARRMSQRQLASRITKEDGTPISFQFLNDVELDRRSPSEFVMGRLAAELNLDKDTLCLLVGFIPKDAESEISAKHTADPKEVTAAWRFFRKRINKKRISRR